jgi:4-amino-4-deoxy-L-arabinose transferase-like glycosyltransferase
MLNKRDKNQLFFWIIIVLIHLGYFAITVINGHMYMADSNEYLQQVFNVKNYSSFYCLDFNQPLNMHFFTKRPPLYGLFILFFKTIIDSNFFVLFVQNILSLLNIIVLVKILSFYMFSYDFKKIILLLLVLLPVQFIYNNMIMSEILLQTLLFFSFFYFFLFIQKNKTGYIIACNIFLALAVLTKPVLLYFWIPNLILLIFLFWRKRRIEILLSGLIMPLVIFLLSFYNYNVTGSFHYSSIRQMNLVGYNSALLLVNVYGEEEGWKKMVEIRNHLDPINNFSELQKEEDRMGYEIIMAHKCEYAKYHIKGIINFFMDPGRFDLNNYLGIKEGNNTGLLYVFTNEGYIGVFKFILRQPFYMIFYISVVLIVNIVFVVSLISFIFEKKVRKELKIFLFMLIVYLSFFSGPLGTMRYKVHVIPLILITIPFFFEKLKNKIDKRKSISIQNPSFLKN